MIFNSPSRKKVTIFSPPKMIENKTMINRESVHTP